MGRSSWAASGVAIFMLLGGCSLFGGGEPESFSPVAESPSWSSSQPLATPKSPNAILIKPTNPEQRLRHLKSGRIDPFRALVSAPTTSTASSGLTATKRSSGPSIIKASSSQTTSTTRAYSPSYPSTPTTSRQTSTSRSSRRTSSGSSSSQLRLPTLPQPDLARGVQVTGIVSVAGVPRAIVKVPGEAVSRSVTSGERLANGQVLVKRIDLEGSKSVVILEQYGTEVAVGVGKKSS